MPNTTTVSSLQKKTNDGEGHMQLHLYAVRNKRSKFW